MRGAALATFVDVGANIGLFALSAARSGADRVIAIEPIPSLADQIELAAEREGLSQVEVVRKAVALAAGARTLNVSMRGDMGISSLLNLREDLSDDPYWATRSDLGFDQLVEVDVAPLADILLPLGLPGIDFIKIDCQGLDLAVLQSLGDGLRELRGGMLEVSTTRHTALYEDEASVLEDVLNWLKASSFDVYAIKPNDPALNEVNVYFCRSGMDFREYEAELGLKNLALYADRHFWHCPAPDPDPSTSPVISAMASEVACISQEVGRLSDVIAAQMSEIDEKQRLISVLTRSVEAAFDREAEAKANIGLSALQQELASERQRAVSLGEEIDHLRHQHQAGIAELQAEVERLAKIASDEELGAKKATYDRDVALAEVQALKTRLGGLEHAQREALQKLDEATIKLDLSERLRSRLELRRSVSHNAPA